MTSEKRPVGAPLSIRQLMTESETGFGRILKRARAIGQLNQRVSGLLDDDLADNCQVANVRDGRLIFACYSSGCATRLRLQSNKLLEDLHAAGLKEIKSIEVKMTTRAVDGSRKATYRKV